VAAINNSQAQGTRTVTLRAASSVQQAQANVQVLDDDVVGISITPVEAESKWAVVRLQCHGLGRR
jgi:hypothetical protein